jgi:three-Cys-motif partner protein
MSTEEFFNESRDQSEIKSRIVAKYFWAWAKVIIPSAKIHGNRIAYVDLFAGPGRYEDGTVSTPLMVLEKAIADPDMRNMLVAVLNDRNSDYVGSLREAIDRLPGVSQLKYQPEVRNDQIGTEIVKAFRQVRLVPTFLFVDPWGYKGLSLALINSVLKDWGCDCIFFFNYNRINMGLTNESVREHMHALFGEGRADSIRERLEGLGSDERESLIIEELSSALRETGAKYVLPFAFRNEQGTRTKHHLIFTSKNFKGYEIMKGIMAKESSAQEQGVPSFEYSRASQIYPLLFALNRPLDDLEEMLLTEFAGQKLIMRQIYERHSVDKPYIESNYKRALTNMEIAGKIQAAPPARERRKGTFADSVVVTFPQRSTQ